MHLAFSDDEDHHKNVTHISCCGGEEEAIIKDVVIYRISLNIWLNLHYDFPQ